MGGDSPRVIAEVATPTIAMAALRCAVAEHPDKRVTLYVNGYPAVEEGP